MKAIYKILCIILCLCPAYAWSQVDANAYMPLPAKPAKLWRLASVGLTIGGYNDNYGNSMNYQDALRMTANATTFSSIELADYALSGYGVAMSGANLGAYVTFHPFSSKRQDFHLNHSLRLGVSANIGRELTVDYYDTNITYEAHDNPYPPMGTGDVYLDECPVYNSNYITYCLVENEVQVSASYLFSLGKKRWSLYGGPGVNIGGTFDSFLMILSSNNQWNGLTEQSRNSVYMRMYALGGASFRFTSKVSATMEFQKGGGVQLVNGASNQSFKNSAFQLGLKYRLMK